MSKRLLFTRQTSITIAPPTSQLPRSLIPCRYFNKISKKTPPPPAPSQPASHRPYEARKTVLHRKYVSLLRSQPLIVLIQHNNVRGGEWTAIRRALATALEAVDTIKQKEFEASPLAETLDRPSPLAPHIRVSIIQTNVFAAALRVADYLPPGSNIPATSRDAYLATMKYSHASDLLPLLTGPVAVIEIPQVSPAHLSAALNLLFPAKATFKKGTDPMLISGLSKLLLLGARIDKQTIDGDTIRWVGGLGGVEQLRGELVAIMQSLGQTLVGGLQAPSRGLWFAMEGRRVMLEDESKPKDEENPPSQ